MAFNWRKFPWTNLHDLNLDWIIQTVKTLENNLADAVSTFKEMIDTAISNTLTGSGDLTINKTGDVRISGNSVQLTGGAVVSDGAEQLTMHNPNSNTSMGANYSSGVLRLTNNQNEANGVALYAINTPSDGGGDNSDFAANVGYVKTAVEAVSNALATETENRTSGDAALQSTIDSVIMPLINALQKRAPRVFYFSTTAAVAPLTADEVNTIKNALLDRTPVIFIAYNDTEGTQYYYYVVKCVPAPTAENINNGGTINFRTLDNQYSAMLTTGSDNSGSVRFGTIS